MGLLAHVAKAQTISGTIKGLDTGETLSAAIVTIKDLENNTLLYTLSNEGGKYSIELQSLPDASYQLTVSKYGYIEATLVLQIPLTSREIDFELETKILQLDDAIFQARRIPIKQLGDTISFRPEAFADGTERVIEDILKKLPGFDVDPNGTIKFKGREISKLLLEGDDLFNHNYALGSKNISSNIIDEVQAVENYSFNPLLKGVADTDEVAINIKLKKGVSDLSGQADLGVGIANRLDVNANVLLISAIHKNFSNFSFNNVGVNRSPWDYFFISNSKEQREIQGFLSPKLISETSFSGEIENQKAKINQTYQANVNELYKLSKNINARVNFFYFKDQLDMENHSSTHYSFDTGTSLDISADQYIKKNPILFFLDSKITWDIGSNSRLEMDTKWMDEKIHTSNHLLQNYQDRLVSNLNSRRHFLYNDLQYTHKLNASQVLRANLLLSQNSSPQDFVLTPGINIHTGDFTTQHQNHQYANTQRNYTFFLTELLGNHQKDNKYRLAIQTYFRSDHLSSLLQSNYVEDITNHLNLHVWQSSLQADYMWKAQKFSIKPQINLQALKTNLMQQAKETLDRQLYLNSDLKLLYKISDIKHIQAEISHKQQQQQPNNLFINPILTSFRSLHFNDPSLALQKTLLARVGFNHNDLFNQFLFNVHLDWQQRQNTIIYQNHITQSLSNLRAWVLPRSLNQFSATAHVEKFVDILKSSIKANTTISRIKYFNMVNDSDLRENMGNNLLTEFTWRTGFAMPINFQNKVQLNYFQNSSVHAPAFSNTSLQNQFSVNFRYKRAWFALIGYQYFNPDLDMPNAIGFLDAQISYRPLNKSWSIVLEASNLTNHKDFKQIFVSDFYRSEMRQSLNPGFVMLRYSFRF